MANRQTTSFPYTPGTATSLTPQSANVGRTSASYDGVPRGRYPLSNVQGNTWVSQDRGFNFTDKTTITPPDAFPDPARLETQINNLALGIPSWQVKEVLPWEKAPAGALKFMKTYIEFDNVTAEPVPYLGVAPLVRSSRQEAHGYVIKYESAFILEHHFASREEGARYYREHMLQIANAIVNAAREDVIHALITAHDDQISHDYAKGVPSQRDVVESMEEDIMMHAIFQKPNERPIGIIAAHSTEKIRENGGFADSIISSEKLLYYVNTAMREYSSYSEAGDKGVTNVYGKAVDDSTHYAELFGHKIYIARSYRRKNEAGPETHLYARKSIGEYYIARDIYAEDHDENYTSRGLCIQIYDEDNDCMQEIAPEFGLDNSHLFRPDGSPLPLTECSDYQSHIDDPRVANLDLWNYVDVSSGRPEQKVLEYWGEMANPYFKLESKIELAKSVRNAFRRNMSTARFNQLERDIADGVTLLKRLSNIPYSKEAENNMRRFFAVRAQDPGAGGGQNTDINRYFRNNEVNPLDVQVAKRRGNNKDVFVQKELKQDPYTGFAKLVNTITDLRNLNNVNLDTIRGVASLSILVPGLHSFEGLKFIRNQKELWGGPDYPLAAEALVADRFITAVEEITSNLKRYFVGSIFLDEKNAATWWQFPTSETVLVENLMGNNDPPIYFASSPAAAVNAGDANTGDADKPIQSIVATVARTANDSVNDDPSRPFSAEPVIRTADGDGRTGNNLLALYIAASLISIGLRSFEGNEAETNARSIALRRLFGDGAKLGYANLPFTVNDRNQGQAQNTILPRAKTIVGENKELFGLETDEEVDALFEQLMTVYNEARSESADPQRFTKPSIWIRSPFLASAAFATSLAKYMDTANVNDKPLIMPADPNFLDIPISYNRLKNLVKHDPRYSGRPNTLKTEEMHQLPAWVSHIGGHAAIPSENITLASVIKTKHTGELVDYSNIGNQTSQLSARSYISGLSQAPQIGASSFDQREFHDPTSGVYSPQHHEKLKVHAREIDVSGFDPHKKKRLGKRFTAQKKLLEIISSTTFQKSWHTVNEKCDNLIDRIIIHVYEGTPVNKSCASNFLRNNIVLPIQFLYVRKDMRYEMSFLIHCLAGKELGVTYYHDGMLSIGNDQKMGYQFVKFSMNTGASVTNKRNLRVIRGVFSQGCLGGAGVKPVDPKDYLGGTGEIGDQSIITIALPYESRISGPFSVAGKVPVPGQTPRPPVNGDDIGYVTLARYCKIYGFNEMTYGDSTGLGEWNGDRYEHKYSNVLCHMGQHYVFDCKSKQFIFVREGVGHWGPYSYPGAKKVRNGKLFRFEAPNYNGKILIHS